MLRILELRETFSYCGLRILSRTGSGPAGLPGVIPAFFGGKLLILCLKKVPGKK